MKIQRKYEEIRETARILLLNKYNEILLIKVEDNIVFDLHSKNHHPTIKHVTIGGRVEKNETLDQTAKRELLEETRIVTSVELPHVWYGEHLLNWDGKITLMKENFFLYKISNRKKISMFNMTEEEKKIFISYKWWKISELKVTLENIYPKNLGAMLEKLIICTLPKSPIIVNFF